MSIGRIERHLRDGQRHSAIEIVDCELWPGTCYALVGESGIGKTTALEMLALAQRPDRMDGFRFRRAGELIDLTDLFARDDHARLSAVRARHFGYVTQTSLLLPFLTVRENIEVTQSIAGRLDRAQVDRLIDELHLAPLASAMPSALSGGQRQRVCVARALAHRPAVILADEPTSAVDAEMGRLILRVIGTHARESGAVTLVITHNVALAQEFGLSGLVVNSMSTGSGLHTIVTSAGTFPVALTSPAQATP